MSAKSEGSLDYTNLLQGKIWSYCGEYGSNRCSHSAIYFQSGQFSWMIYDKDIPEVKLQILHNIRKLT